MTTPELPPSLHHLAPLIGSWEGEGRGHYPTIEPFRYHESVTISHPGRGFLVYQQRTSAPDGSPMHVETGYLRGAPNDGVELLLSQPTGFVEVHEGTVRDGVLDLTATTVARTGTAKPVHEVRRRFVVAGDTLSYDLWMQHADTPLTHHLHADLRRFAEKDPA